MERFFISIFSSYVSGGQSFPLHFGVFIAGIFNELAAVAFLPPESLDPFLQLIPRRIFYPCHSWFNLSEWNGKPLDSRHL